MSSRSARPAATVSKRTPLTPLARSGSNSRKALTPMAGAAATQPARRPLPTGHSLPLSSVPKPKRGTLVDPAPQPRTTPQPSPPKEAKPAEVSPARRAVIPDTSPSPDTSAARPAHPGAKTPAPVTVPPAPVTVPPAPAPAVPAPAVPAPAVPAPTPAAKPPVAKPKAAAWPLAPVPEATDAETAIMDGARLEPRGGEYASSYPSSGYFACRRCGSFIARAASKAKIEGGYAAFHSFAVRGLRCEMRVGRHHTAFHVHCVRCGAFTGELSKGAATATGDCLRCNSAALWYCSGPEPPTIVVPPDSTFDASDDELSSEDEFDTPARRALKQRQRWE